MAESRHNRQFHQGGTLRIVDAKDTGSANDNLALRGFIPRMQIVLDRIATLLLLYVIGTD